MDTLTGTFFPLIISSPGGKKCLNLGTFFPWGKKTPRQFFPRGKVLAGGEKRLLHRGTPLYDFVEVKPAAVLQIHKKGGPEGRVDKAKMRPLAKRVIAIGGPVPNS